ncbi:MAG: hypothetical protein NTY24_13820, partial [Mycobacterium sp.]|nr:hypothetical protein [Mycobacterium sp.]
QRRHLPYRDLGGLPRPAGTGVEQHHAEHLDFVDDVCHYIRNGDSHHASVIGAVDLVGPEDVRSTLHLGCAAATAVARRGGRRHVRYWLAPDGDG